MSNDLERWFVANGDGRMTMKQMHYFDIYERHLSTYRGRTMTVLEFGVWHGGSMQMWKQYFGANARIIGVDIDPRCQKLAEPQVEIVIGDASDRSFLRGLVDRVGPIDIAIDDCGHTMQQQIITFEEVYPHIIEGGVYLIEDLFTSYYMEFGGGQGSPGTFIEYSKRLVDRMHGWHVRRDRDHSAVDRYTRTIRGMHVYDSLIVFDKDAVAEPITRRSGRRSFPRNAADIYRVARLTARRYQQRATATNGHQRLDPHP